MKLSTRRKKRSRGNRWPRRIFIREAKRFLINGFAPLRSEHVATKLPTTVPCVEYTSKLLIPAALGRNEANKQAESEREPS